MLRVSGHDLGLHEVRLLDSPLGSITFQGFHDVQGVVYLEGAVSPPRSWYRSSNRPKVEGRWPGQSQREFEGRCRLVELAPLKQSSFFGSRSIGVVGLRQNPILLTVRGEGEQDLVLLLEIPITTRTNSTDQKPTKNVEA